MLRLDHIVVASLTLEEGVTHVKRCLGVIVPRGGEHPLMGTHAPGRLHLRFLVLGDEPLMFHTGLRKMFPPSEALSRIIPPERLKWIAYCHFEADECGAMNEWLPVAPQAQAAHGQTGCMVSLNDFADRPPRVLVDGETIDLGGKRVRCIYTPHTPQGWDSGVLYEETTGTLLCGDLFTQLGNDTALTLATWLVRPSRLRTCSSTLRSFRPWAHDPPPRQARAADAGTHAWAVVRR